MISNLSLLIAKLAKFLRGFAPVPHRGAVPPDTQLIINRADAPFAVTFGNRNPIFTNNTDLN